MCTSCIYCHPRYVENGTKAAIWVAFEYAIPISEFEEVAKTIIRNEFEFPYPVDYNTDLRYYTDGTLRSVRYAAMPLLVLSRNASLYRRTLT